MKKTFLTSVSLLVLLGLASCSTDTMPTDSNGARQQNTTFNAQHTKTDQEIQIQNDTLQSNTQVINSASRALENGDLGNLKDKRK